MSGVERIPCPMCGSGSSSGKFKSMDFLYSREEFAVEKCNEMRTAIYEPENQRVRYSPVLFPGICHGGAGKAEGNSSALYRKDRIDRRACTSAGA